MKRKDKILLGIKYFMYLLALVLVLLTVFAKSGSPFDIFNSDENSLKAIGDFFDKQAPAIIKSLVIIITLAFSKILRFVLNKLFSLSQRGRTTVKLLDSFIRYFAAILIVLLVLSAFGVSTMTLLASVGILGLIIGLSAQRLISDIISGLFIVFEGDYEVGDYIVIEGFRGVVLAIGIRTTKIVDYAGNIKIINNSEITTVVNLSKEPSAVVLEVFVSHLDYNKADKILKDELPKLKDKYPIFTSFPSYLGPNDINERGLQLMFLGYAKEDDRFGAGREFVRIIKKIFDDNNIIIPSQKYSLNK